MSNDKIGTKHLTHRPRVPEGRSGVEFDRHSEPWEVMKLLYDGLRQITELENCYNHAPGKTPEDSIANEEVECMIHHMKPMKDITCTLRFVVTARDVGDITVTEVKDALHALLTEAGNGYLMRHVTPEEDKQCPRCKGMFLPDCVFYRNGPDAEPVCGICHEWEPEDKPTCKPRCHECGYTIGKAQTQLTVDGFEYHKVCWNQVNNS